MGKNIEMKTKFLKKIATLEIISPYFEAQIMPTLFERRHARCPNKFRVFLLVSACVSVCLLVCLSAGPSQGLKICEGWRGHVLM